MAKQDKDMAIDDALGIDSYEPRVYELGFHLDPELPVEEMKKAYRAVRELIANNGTVVADGEPQKIQLAYIISRHETSGRRDFDSAYFAWVVYEAVADSHAEILKVASADKKIIRFIDLLTTKDSARHSAEVREISMKTQEHKKEDADEIAGAELDAVLENIVV